MPIGTFQVFLKQQILQKKIIALAVAALASTAAFAQSNVTVYGIADAYVGSFKTDGAQRQGVVNSGGLSTSRIGFKGTEDLGNGLKSLFALEYALAIDADQGAIAATSTSSGGITTTTTGTNGSGIGAARQALVGLTGGFGTAVAGRLQTTGFDWALKYDILAGTAISPLQNTNTAAQIVSVGTNTGAAIGGTTFAARANNAVAYISPSFSGLTFAYNHAQVTEQTVNVANNNISANLLSANYANGPMAAGLVFARVKAAGLAAGTADKTTDWALGGSYDLTVAKLTGTYQRTKTGGNGFTGVAGVNDASANSIFSLGVAVPVTAKGTVIASYAKNSVKNTTAADNTNSYTLAYTHALSKRTTAYAGYSAINRASGIAQTVTGATLNGVVTNTVLGADTSMLVAGMRHSF